MVDGDPLSRRRDDPILATGDSILAGKVEPEDAMHCPGTTAPQSKGDRWGRD